eukprot:CAMPEP_0198558976 /NCGR_PEP_ID=MMETSP1462-20131121/91460_1 /TAXON_ID=1333877 /ORGANISM="Brandtodinium nutriculum, Strain RCC3387" /LENGTH=40 /DNA_ID= /DNA_START= /DNA_END= /DNA_ORIENTATION=
MSTFFAFEAWTVWPLMKGKHQNELKSQAPLLLPSLVAQAW